MAMSRRSTSTTTTWRRRSGSSDASVTPDSSASSSRWYSACVRISPRYSSGPTTTMSHAPSRNLAKAKITTTVNERKAEKPLTATLRRQCFPFAVRWCFTMPEPAMVKPVNTPMA